MRFTGDQGKRSGRPDRDTANSRRVVRTMSNSYSIERTIRARGKTVVSISLASALALSVPVLINELQFIFIVPPVALAFAAMIALALRADIWVDARNRLHVRYLVYSFSTKLKHLQRAPTPKFDFRRDEELGLARMYQGTRVPSFRVGWFLLRNQSVAFACVTRKRRAQAFKIRKGLYLVVDPALARQIQVAANAACSLKRKNRKNRA